MPNDQAPFGMQPEGGDRPVAQFAPEIWGQALLALLTTCAIVVIALAVPVLIAPLTTQFVAPSKAETPDASLINWLHILSFQLSVVVLTILIAARKARELLGWRPANGQLSWLQPLLLTIAVSAVTAFVAFTFFADIVARDLELIRKLVEAAPIWIAVLALAVGAPLSEELLFRGYLLHSLKDSPLGFWGAALVANTGWTLLHFGYSWLSLADVFLAGLLFSWALWRTRSIWVPITFHAIYNAVVLFILLIPATRAPVPGLMSLIFG